MVASAFSKPSTEGRARKFSGALRKIYESRTLTAETWGAGSVRVKVNLEKGFFNTPSNEAKSTTTHKKLYERALAERLEESFQNELDNLVAAYRSLLREGLATGDDPKVKEALNRARLQERILVQTSMVDQAQACELLGMSTANPSATMKRKEDRKEILRFTVEGRVVYPLFQFDVENRSVFPVMSALIKRKPAGWSDFRLLYWLTREHLDFGAAPSDCLGHSAEAVIAAFEREIELPEHG